MDEGVLALDVPEPQGGIELLVRGRQLELPTGVEVAVALEGGLSTVVQEGLRSEVGGTFPAEEGEEHPFVVTHEKGARVALIELEQEVHHSLGVGSPIDVVAHKHELIVVLEGQRTDELLELIKLAVDIAYRVQHPVMLYRLESGELGLLAASPMVPSCPQAA